MKQIFKILSDPHPHFIGTSEGYPTSHPFFYKAADATGAKVFILSARGDYAYGLPVQLNTEIYRHMFVQPYHVDQAKPDVAEPHVRSHRPDWDYQ